MGHTKYCPFCCRYIDPCCDENGDVIGSEYTGFVYVHVVVFTCHCVVITQILRLP